MSQINPGSTVDPGKPAPSALEKDGPRSTRQEQAGGTRSSHRGLFWIVALAVLGAGGYFLWRNGIAAKLTSPPPAAAGKSGRPATIPVVAARVTRGNIGVYVTGLGAVTPIYTVTVKSRVDGQLMQVLYKEGELVHQGDLLVEIDPRPYQVQLEQAEGQLAKDEANLANARVDLTRYETLLKQNAVPEQTLATQQALVKQDEGIVKSDQGQIDAAKLNLAYCHIAAPITGRIGLRLIDPGNIVHASDANGLLVITQLEPISVIFTIAEDQVPAVLQRLRAGRTLRVDAYDHEMTKRLAQGTVTTVDNQIDQSTGTLRVRASFDNKDDALFPNQFVNARLLVEEKTGVTLAPSAAVQRNSQSTYVYLVKPDSTVTVDQVTLGTTEGEQTEVTSGLSPGDIVVMTGVDKLQERSKVSVRFEGEAGNRTRRGK